MSCFKKLKVETDPETGEKTHSLEDVDPWNAAMHGCTALGMLVLRWMFRIGIIGTITYFGCRMAITHGGF